MALFTAAMAAYSLWNSNEAAGEAESLSKRNAKFGVNEANENIRKTRLEQERQRSTAEANYGASGIDLNKSESVTAFLENMDSTFKKDIDWLEKARESNRSIELTRGKNTAKVARNNAISSFVTTVSDIDFSSDGGVNKPTKVTK